ncbi:hypothetical protein BGZ76_011816 [Entomortierella beljakovae]|nr:hypothetical protein BGZ76_011816 [Entomortierella beljakovae]
MASDHLVLPLRNHLITLDIVSKNGYSSNIRGFRFTSNLALIKSILWNNRAVMNAIPDMVKNDSNENAIPANAVLWAVGLSKFSTKSRLLSLHGTSESKGHAVVGINEY